jgi:Arc/MetJ-type ribon-helix-helix transcriptional regulator
MSTKYRAQILLEPEQHEALVKIAQKEQRSISDVMREIVNDWLSRRDRKAQRRRELEALEELTQLRKKIEEDHGVYHGDLIEETRTGRDEDMSRVWRGED